MSKRGQTRRRWSTRANVGYASTEEVAALQTKVHDYAAQLQAVIDAQAAAGKGLDIHGGPHSIQAWGDLAGRVAAFVSQPPAHFFTGGQWELGRGLVTELDGWRDYLASVGAPNVPDPVPVPQAQTSLLEAGGTGIGLGLALLVGLLLLHETR